MKLLVITGSLLVVLSIATGWLLVARRYLALAPVVKLIKDDSRLLKGHLEYPIMALLLFSFYALHFDLPLYLVLPACIGACTNPSLHCVLAIMPGVSRNTTSPFGVFSTLSFLLTTIGLGGMAGAVLFEVLR